jgi:subfamily B ATP-binding cassette protein MsbA
MSFKTYIARKSPYFARLWEMHVPYTQRLVVAGLALMVTAFTEPAIPVVLKYLVDDGFGSTPRFPRWLVPVAVVAVFLLRGSSTYLSTYLMTWVSTRVLNDLRRAMFTRLLHVPLSFFNDNSTGRVINAMMYEVQQIVEMITKVLISIVRSALTVVGLLVTLLFLNWKLTLITLVLLPAMLLVVRKTGGRLKRLNKDSLTVNAHMTQVLEETTRAQQVIKVFGGQPYEQNRFDQRADELRRYTMRMTSAFAATVPITQLMTACAIAVIISLALVQHEHGALSVGSFIAFMGAIIMLLTPLKQLAEVNGPLQRGMAACEAVFGFIDIEVERTDGAILAGKAQGHLEYRDVSFSYPGQQKPALSGVNLVVAPGETIALVGVSGGGKTTMVSLLPGFYPVGSGSILLDGQSINDISLKSLRAQMAMVSQHVVLFDNTVAANIAYGDAHPDQARIEAAARAAHLADVIAGLPNGYDTMIGDNGARLSGGQRQRMAIARAIYKDAPLLILDEATSALDTESERSVQAALDTLMQGRTTFVIAHRLSTIENASRIVVMSDGKIVEIGSHDELLTKGGAYANLYRLQFSRESTVRPVAPML